ncbi:Translation initiation factor eIF-2B subunit alpha [Geodia barretti]|uniref:Translation initiation factor eIF2B subunit alpha n=1 Tax=Geodia barretti TaxID=519541 RepID=A0AA35SCJ2_GEOBA|nr:Translation initiation factor eIF-2B subunit alpha [Geodia barretti]
MGEQGVAVRASVSSESQLTEQETDELVKEFEAALDQNLSEAVAAIQTLLKFIKTCKVGTISGLRAELKVATETLIKARTSTVSVSSGCELFLRFITMTSLEGQNVRLCYRLVWMRRGRVCLNTPPLSFPAFWEMRGERKGVLISEVSSFQGCPY